MIYCNRYRLGRVAKMRASSWKCPGFIKNRHGCALGLVLLLLALHAAMGTSPLTPGAYNSYTLQALAWRGGKTYLPADVPHLELAIKDGLYYVSFPPVPSIPLYFLSFLFGEAIPDGLLVMLYILIAYYALAHALEQGGWREMQLLSAPSCFVRPLPCCRCCSAEQFGIRLR